MNLAYKHLLPENFAPESKVWIYQSSRRFTLSGALELEETLNDFVAGWTSHGARVKGFATLFFGQFIVLMADETQAGVSGCSTDSSVRMIKAIEEKYKVQLFDRQMLAFVVQEKIQLLPLSQLPYAVENKFVEHHTLYFNNVVGDKDALEKQWIIPAGESWLSKRVAFDTTAIH
ncbi:MAG: hypothetical protein FJX94_07770 [Bacteroidetes bacterium]|nr:hypothetical protein [Bacteroidota bacterium]